MKQVVRVIRGGKTVAGEPAPGWDFEGSPGIQGPEAEAEPIRKILTMESKVEQQLSATGGSAVENAVAFPIGRSVLVRGGVHTGALEFCSLACQDLTSV